MQNDSNFHLVHPNKLISDHWAAKEINSFIGLSITFDLDSRIQNKLKEKCSYNLKTAK
jgi:hypothetical protein